MTPSVLPTAALDDRIAIVGTAGSGKTYTAKGFVERLLDAGDRVTIVDPLGVWWGLRAGAAGEGGYPVFLFGGRHADVPITADGGAVLGQLIAKQALASVVDLSELGSNAVRRQFMAAFAEAIYEANEEPLHLVFDEADLWAPQRRIKGCEGLLGHIEEIVRRGRVRGFIPWLITQRPAVVHKDVLSQADILITMKLTSSQDREAIGAWIEGQADRQQGRRILAELPRLRQGEGYLWAPRHELLERVQFPVIRTFDSSRTPRRGERPAAPRTLAEVDLTAITAALAEAIGPDPSKPGRREPTDDRRLAELQGELTAAKQRIAELEQENRDLIERLEQIVALAFGPFSMAKPARTTEQWSAMQPSAAPRPRPRASSSHGADGDIQGAARKLLIAAAQHAPARFTWGQLATLAGLKPSGGHFNVGRKQLRQNGYIDENNDLVGVTKAGLKAAGTVPLAPSTPAERLALWCERLPAPAPEILRTLAAQNGCSMSADELAAALGKKPSGGHWNSGIAILRNNRLIEADPVVGTGRRYRLAVLLRA
jgi:hypothetical protein